MRFDELPWCDAAVSTVAMAPTAPAVVIRGDLGGLGVVRSLGRGGVVSYVLDCDRFNPGMWSCHARPVFSQALKGSILVDALLQLGLALKERPVLFNTHEDAVYTISEHRGKLAHAFRFRLPPHDRIVALQDKARFHELAESCGLPVPKAAIIRAASDISRLVDLRFPIVVKPADKAVVHAGRVPRLLFFDRVPHAIAGCARMLEWAGEIIAQEWIGGGDDNIYFCLFYCGRGGEMVSMFTGRKLASNPPRIGSTALCTAAPEACSILEPMTRAFLDTMDYAGMGSVEYKWDDARSRFIIIEPTVGRTDWQEEIATLCGANIPLAAYHHELGLDPPRPVPLPGNVVWRASVVERLLIGAVPLPAESVVIDGYWRRGDPMPAVIQYPWRSVADAARRRLRKGDRARTGSAASNSTNGKFDHR